MAVTHTSCRELVLGAGALLYYLPNGTRVTQETSEQVGPECIVSLSAISEPRKDPSMGLALDSPPLCCRSTAATRGWCGASLAPGPASAPAPDSGEPPVPAVPEPGFHCAADASSPLPQWPPLAVGDQKLRDRARCQQPPRAACRVPATGGPTGATGLWAGPPGSAPGGGDGAPWATEGGSPTGLAPPEGPLAHALTPSLPQGKRAVAEQWFVELVMVVDHAAVSAGQMALAQGLPCSPASLPDTPLCAPSSRITATCNVSAPGPWKSPTRWMR